ncbi:MAG TPA: dephospho-CoA kinase [Candidatus Limnocylindrales bacterium]|nr:dephospho-CoA kinase [Candidatus Limnocylindrales bacterium]
MTLTIGITGPIGCGKSTVASWLGERAGVTVIDADHEARMVLAPGTPEVEAVYRRFGADLRRPNGELDRAALGRIVFRDPAALGDLEAIVHPAVRPRILDAIERAERGGARAVVVEAIKLVEGGLAELCDQVWLVTCDPTTQRERLVGRGDAEEDAAARVAAQGELVERLRPRATRVIDTSGEVAATRAAVDGMLDEALDPSG